MENSGKFMGALLLGAVIGVGAGILLAPDKGSETRKKLFKGSKDLADELKERIKESLGKLGDIDEEAEEKLDDFIKTIKSNMGHDYKHKNDMA